MNSRLDARSDTARAPRAPAEPGSIDARIEAAQFVAGRLARRLVRDPARADDVAQQAVLASLAHPPRAGWAPVAWISGVTRNLVRKERRGDARRMRREQIAAKPESVPSTDELVVRLDEQRALLAAVRALDEPYRGAILLRYFEGMAPRDIAKSRGLAIDTVRSHLQRGLAILRTRLDASHGGDRRQWCVALLPLARGPAIRTGRSAPVLAAVAAVVLVAIGGGVLVARAGDDAPAAPTTLPNDERAPTTPPPDCVPSRDNPARLRFDLPADRVDLGAVKQDRTIEHDVVVRNTGTGTLCFPAKPHTGCGCVQAEWVGEARVLPGGTGIVRLRIDPRGREGHVAKEVTVSSNDPDRPKAVFHVQFDVKRGVVVARSANVTAGSVVYFGRHAPGRPGTAVVRLKSPREDSEWMVTAVVSSKPERTTNGTKTEFAWSVAPVEPNDPVFRQLDVTITHPGSQQLDLNDESLKIVTTHPDRPEILLQSQLLVAKKYYTSPPTVRFGFVGGALGTVTTPRVVTVFPGEEGTTFAVTKALVEGPGFTAGVPVDHGKDGWQVEIRYDEQKRGKGPVDAKLVVHFSDSEFPVVEVPLHAEVRD